MVKAFSVEGYPKDNAAVTDSCSAALSGRVQPPMYDGHNLTSCY